MGTAQHTMHRLVVFTLAFTVGSFVAGICVDLVQASPLEAAQRHDPTGQGSFHRQGLLREQQKVFEYVTKRHSDAVLQRDRFAGEATTIFWVFPNEIDPSTHQILPSSVKSPPTEHKSGQAEEFLGYPTPRPDD